MPTETYDGESLELFARAEDAAGQIPPLWPLTESVAVNPFLGQSGEPLAAAAARLSRVAGTPITPARSIWHAALAAGEITDHDLTDALAAASHGATYTASDLKAAAARDAPRPDPIPTIADLARCATGTDWPAHIAERMGHWAAGHFDAGQALWPAPDVGAYVSWKSYAQRDITPELQGLGGFCAFVTEMPVLPRPALAGLGRRLKLDAAAAEGYFHRLLSDLGGWAQYARKFGWEAERDGGTDSTLTDLLTARLVWEAALLERHAEAIGDGWRDAQTAFAAPITPSADQVIDAILQDAADRGAQRRLAAGFDAAACARAAADDASTADVPRPQVQAAFCIDVRSEVFRRALEASGEGIATIGFAGFFGLPSSHRAAASDVVEAHSPVLLKPPLSSTAADTAAEDMAVRIKHRASRAWGRFKGAAVSSFAFVEAAGPIYAAKLLRDSRGKAQDAPIDPMPRFDPVPPLEDRIGMVGTVLSAMSLNGTLAPLVVIAGHGAQVTNNAHESALQCGACGGHAGDVNARLLAGLLNDPEVRAGLADAGRPVPEDTLFVAGLHNTTTDQMTLFDADAPATAHKDALKTFSKALSAAAKLARAERALRLPRAGGGGDLVARAHDWAELRPEWGLAGCRAFVAAPRHRTTGMDLAGQAFLHSYDWQKDDGFGILELILTAPVVVASWISLQYYGSTVAPDQFGSGNKLLHNVTGGIGVVEGNGGLLRAGLPWQSVHDGDACAHTPLRLSVVIEAPTEAISGILKKHPGVAELFDNGWLALFAMDSHGRMAWRYDGGSWANELVAAPVSVAAE